MTTSPFDLTGRNAVITGSTKGIGKAIAQLFADLGARVVISSRNAGRCDVVAAEINARYPGRAIAIPASIGVKADLERLTCEAESALGSVDILVLNAATNPFYGSMSEISDDQFRKVLENNLLGAHWLIQFLLPGMIARRRGNIIIISSIGGLRGTAVIGAYNMSKAADFQLARNLAIEVGKHDIRVNCIAPGMVKTDFAREIWENEEHMRRVIADTPLGRIGDPRDIAGVAAFLASDASRFVHGQTIVADGGVTVTISGI
ncbi:SDR family oxidoreductase [Nitrobacter sp.]|uniref:SDR family NAD(P)-dependent oxidoreductase n=1 Tax=Nitrobacter sp. TaxID=29420 RepID=UPI0029CABB09|nr:SDR family oxidoreductase [Nitrobacter sp.]